MLKKFSYLILLYSLFYCNLSFAAVSQQPIAIEKAFTFSVSPTQTDSILANWNIAPGYYLYKNSLSFSILDPKNALLGMIVKPQGIKKHDAILGEHYVYTQHLQLSIPIVNPSVTPLKLLVHYQGCSSWGFCYPPVTKLVLVKNKNELTANDISVSNYIAPPSTKESNFAVTSQIPTEKILQTKNSLIALFLFFGFGILLAFTPCVLPMIPILSSIIVGQDKINTKRAFLLSLSYVLGMAFTFTIAGLLVGLLGSSVQAALQIPWIIFIFALLFILLALSLFGLYELTVPQIWHQYIGKLHHKQKTDHYFGVAIIGALSTLVISPCVTAPLVGALAYIGNTGNALFGGLALLVLGLGMGLPLLIVGTAFGKLIPKAGVWTEHVKHFFGLLMLGVAIWILERILPAYIILGLWGILAIISAIFMDAFVPTQPSGLAKLSKGLGLAVFVYGILLLVGATMGNTSLLQPIKLTSAVALTHTQALEFQKVRSIAELDNLLKSNRSKNIMLDFYADWCVSCKELDANVFSNAQVKTALKNFVLLRADITANNAADKALEKKYGVIAPPTILFFDKNGMEISAARVIGQIDTPEFLENLRKVSS